MRETASPRMTEQAADYAVSGGQGDILLTVTLHHRKLTPSPDGDCTVLELGNFPVRVQRCVGHQAKGTNTAPWGVPSSRLTCKVTCPRRDSMALCSEPLPAWVFEGQVAEKGVHTPEGSYSAASNSYVPRSTLDVYQRQEFRAQVFGSGAIDGTKAGTTVFEDESVRLWHSGDEVLVISLKTKMHVIGDGVIKGLKMGLEEAGKNFKGLVIWSADAADGGAFSAGADLQSALPAFMQGGAKAVDPIIKELQDTFQAMKYSNVPVVAAVAGLALGVSAPVIIGVRADMPAAPSPSPSSPAHTTSRWAALRAHCANIFRLGIKELWSLWRDPAMLFLIVYTTTLAVYSAGKAQPETLSHVPIAIVDEDVSALSQRIATAFFAPQFVGPDLITPQDVDPGLDAGRYTLVLHIPPNFQRDVLAGKVPRVQLNMDATRMMQAFSSNGAVQQIVQSERCTNSAVSAPAIDLVVRARFNPALTPSWFGSVMELINIVTMLSIILTGAALIREREHGTVEHLLVKV
eukprot:gene24555-30917_t